MRRLTLYLSLVLVTGCQGGLGNLFSAHAKVAARAGAATLAPESLAVILTGLKGARLSPETADFVANLWVNYHLFGQAVADGKITTDSAAVAEVMWPEITERIAGIWHDTVYAHHTTFKPSSVDSAYGSTDPRALRLVQHILVTVPANAPAADREKALKKIEGAAASIRGGANFGALALKLSGDPGSARDSGYMDPAPRGAYVTSFDSAAWALAPGQVSGIITTPYGYHIVRRPPINEIRGRFLEFLGRRAGITLDSMYFDSLSRARHLTISSKAPTRLRELLADRESYRHSNTSFASFDGGGLPAREMVKWVNVLPPQIASGLGQATDSQISLFVRRVAENVLFVQDARAHGVGISPTDLAALQVAYVAGLDSLKAKMGLGKDVTDPSIPLADREKTAASRVDEFLASGFGAKVRMVPIPPAMVDYLRDRYSSRVDPQGTSRAVELALTLKATAEMAADSAAKAKGQIPPSQLPTNVMPSGKAPPAAPPAQK